MSTGKLWTKEEIAYLKKRINDGVHPLDLSPEISKKFGYDRTTEAIKLQCSKRGIPYSHCKSKYQKKREAEQKAELERVEKRIEEKEEPDYDKLIKEKKARADK